MPNKIGEYEFLRMSQLEPISNHIFKQTRTGVDGHAFWQAGRRGDTFSIETFHPFTDLAAAWNAYEGYKALKAEVVQAEWESVETQFVVVHNVEKIGRGVRTILNGMSSFGQNHRAVVEARFTVTTIEELTGMAGQIERQVQSRDVNFNSSDTSDVVDLSGAAGAQIYLPAAFAGTTLEVLALVPDSNPEEYKPINQDGAAVPFTVVADGFNVIPESLYGNFQKVKFKSSASENLTGKIVTNT